MDNSELEVYKAITNYGLENHLTWQQTLKAVAEMFEEQSIDNGKVSSIDINKSEIVRKVYVCPICDYEHKNKELAIECCGGRD